MNKFARSVLFAVELALGASGLAGAQSNDNGMEQWFNAKYGRSSPMEEARFKAGLADMAFREEPSQPTAAGWTERYFKAKFGRNAPTEESQLQAERDSTAYREEPAIEGTSAQRLRDEHYRSKYGRLPGK